MLTKDELTKLEEVLALAYQLITKNQDNIETIGLQNSVVDQGQVLILREKRHLTQWETEKKLAMAALEAMDKTQLRESYKDDVLEGLLETHVPDDLEILLEYALSDLSVMEIEPRMYEPGSPATTLLFALREDLYNSLEERYHELADEVDDVN